MEIEEAREHLRWRALQQYLTVSLIVARLSILDVCGAPVSTSGNSAT